MYIISLISLMKSWDVELVAWKNGLIYWYIVRIV